MLAHLITFSIKVSYYVKHIILVLDEDNRLLRKAKKIAMKLDAS